MIFWWLILGALLLFVGGFDLTELLLALINPSVSG